MEIKGIPNRYSIGKSHSFIWIRNLRAYSLPSPMEGVRYVDKLVKVQLRDGGEQFVPIFLQDH